MRTVILHYHIYKNSGTSFDQVLTHNFPDRHELFDGPYPFFIIDQEQVDRIIMRKRDAVAFSSHQLLLPQPGSLDYRVLAAVFVRNPFLRIASIYRFKRGPERADGSAMAIPRSDDASWNRLRPENIDRTTTGIAAQQHDFAGWLDHCLSTPAETVHVSNAQTRFFAATHRSRPAFRRGANAVNYDLATARRHLAGIELLGRTEHFEDDVRRMGTILSDFDISFAMPTDTRHNVTHDSTRSVQDRVAELLDSLPADLRTRIIAANQQDLALYDRACELIEQDHRP